MKRRRFRRRIDKKKIALRIIGFVLCVACLVCYYFQKLRPLVIRYAVSYAESMFLSSADSAVIRVLSQENIQYDDIIRLSRTEQGAVTSAETDIVKINTLKSMISDTLFGLIREHEDYEVAIPIGALFSEAYANGWGPKLRFRMQLTATARVNFSHEFKAAGINQVLHIVTVDMDIGGSLILLGCSRGIHAVTSVFAAQTLIVGTVPGAFTEVNQGGTHDLAGTINDYGADLNEQDSG